MARGDNLTDQDRAKGGQNSHSSLSTQDDTTSGSKGGQSGQGKGWKGDPQGHAQAGSQSSGNTGDTEEHARAESESHKND